MKKLLLILLIVVIIFSIGCIKVTKEKSEKKLDELQTTVCEEAEKAGTCQTRLVEIGIVMPNECCEILGRCCE